MFSKSCEIIASLICWFGVFFAIHSTMLVLGFHCDFFSKVYFYILGEICILSKIQKTSKKTLLPAVEQPHPTLLRHHFACSSFPLPPSPPPSPPLGGGVGGGICFSQKEGLDGEALGSSGASEKLGAAWGSSGDL